MACKKVTQARRSFAENLNSAVGEFDLRRNKTYIGIFVKISGESRDDVILDRNIGVDDNVIIGIEPVRNQVVTRAEADIAAASDNGYLGISFFYMFRSSVC